MSEEYDTAMIDDLERDRVATEKMLKEMDVLYVADVCKKLKLTKKEVLKLCEIDFFLHVYDGGILKFPRFQFSKNGMLTGFCTIMEIFNQRGHKDFWEKYLFFITANQKIPSRVTENLKRGYISSAMQETWVYFHGGPSD